MVRTGSLSAHRQTRLLRGPQRQPHRQRGRDQAVLSPAGDEVPPRPQRGRRQGRGRGEVQGVLRGVRGAVRRRQTAAVRPVRPRRRVGQPRLLSTWSRRTSSRCSRTSSAGGAGRGGRGTRGAGGRGFDLEIQVELSLAEIASGAEKTLEFERQDLCEQCKGTGAKGGHGPGRVRAVRRAGQDRPAGVRRDVPHGHHVPQLPRPGHGRPRALPSLRRHRPAAEEARR